MRKKSIILLCSVFAFFVLTAMSCGEEQQKNSSQKQEQALTEQKQQAFLKTQPPPDLKGFSLEREQLTKRTMLWNDKNKVSYVYLISYGNIMAFYTIKGKVSSVNSLMTNPENVEWRDGTGTGASWATAITTAPAEDGSYGTNGDAIFFFTTDGTYVEWMGEYMLCDKPLTLRTPPQIVYEVATNAEDL